MARRLTYLILLAMVLGIVGGFLVNRLLPAHADAIADGLGVVTALFLRLIKMIIAPLVFATLVGGIAHMGAEGGLGRIGLRTIGCFVAASLFSLTLGLVLVNLLRPGVGLSLPLPPAGASSGVATGPFNLKDFFLHIVPASPVQAMADNEILQIVVFAGFFGVAAAAVGEPARPIVRGVEALAQVMLTVTGYVMRFAPLAVFAAVAGAIATRGIGILSTFGAFMGGFYLGLVLLWLALFGVAALILGGRARGLFALVREPFLLAFTTASSEAAFPRTLEALERFGVPPGSCCCSAIRSISPAR